MVRELFAGNDERLEFTIYQAESETPLDLTNMTVVWGLADRVTDAPILTKDSSNTGEIDIVDAVNGRFDVLLAAIDTTDIGGLFYHEVELTDVDGNQFTVFSGKVYIEPTMMS